jgi:hypothetical protein
MSFARKRAELEIITLSEISQTQKEKYCMFSSYVDSRRRIFLKDHTSRTETIRESKGDKEKGTKGRY